MKTRSTLKNEIPIFFAVDDRYLPYLAVALRSLIDNASKEYNYKVFILIDELSKESRSVICEMCTDNFSAEFICVKECLASFSEKLHLRDYYTKATYYRFFIPEMFPCYDKGVYLDCDIVVSGDISRLYNTNLSNNIVAAVTDEVITDIPVFAAYSEKFLNIERRKYFNAGILVMNLKEMRRMNIIGCLTSLMKKRTFTVAQDQDYLNVICYDRVKYVDGSWNKTPFPYSDKKAVPNIAHYKINFKPWHYSGVMYEELFWKYAEKTPYYSSLLAERDGYTEENQARDNEQYENLKKLAMSEILSVSPEKTVIPKSFMLRGVI